MTATAGPLLHPVRPRVIAKYLGELSLPLALLLAVPTVVAALAGEYAFATRLLLAAVLPAALLALVTRRAPLPAPPPSPMQVNEALALSALTFIIAPLFLVYPLAAEGIPPLDALFEAVSGVTTTGLTTLASIEALSPALLFTRAWLQWFGGLGIVVLAVALLFGPGPESRRLAGTAWEEGNLVASTRLHGRRVLAVYLVLTAIGLTLLTLMGMTPWRALLHTLSAVSTGGFSPYDASLAAVGDGAALATLSLALLGALPLPLFYRLYRNGPAEPWRSVELRALVAATLTVALLLALLTDLSPLHALLQALSAQTGTGFSTVEIAALPDAGKGVLSVSMFVGAGVGSTAGGIKLLRLLILLRLIQLALLRTRLPRDAVAAPTFNGHHLNNGQLERALLIIALFAMLTLLSWIPFLAAGHPPLDALFEVISAVATAGLSTGITSPELAAGLKGVLIFDMLAGRVEILALLVVLAPGSWRK